MRIILDTLGVQANTLLVGDKHVLIDVKETRDGCILAIEPIARIIDNKPDDVDLAYDVQVVLDNKEYPFHVSQRFASYYATLDIISLEVKQRLKSKYLSFQLPKPLIIKTCQKGEIR